jgi:hypothetical protein
MAERIIRVLVDDLDETEIPDGKGGSVKFAFRGTSYTIDLSEGNVAKLEKALAPFIAAATRTSGPPPRAPRKATNRRRRRKSAQPAKKSAQPAKKSTPDSSNAAIRAWAIENGHAVSARGRIGQSVVDAYKAAKKSKS